MNKRNSEMDLQHKKECTDKCCSKDTPQNIMLTERTQLRKTTNCVIPFMRNVQDGQISTDIFSEVFALKELITWCILYLNKVV